MKEGTAMKKLTQQEYAALFADRGAAIGSGFSISISEPGDFVLPGRKPQTHKYSYGRALILAGSVGFSGAPTLAANACEKSGAGLTTLMVPEQIYMIAASRCDGAVVIPLPGTEDGCAHPDALQKILPALEKADACVIGPGFGTGRSSAEILRDVLRHAACPLVLDADALTVCGREPDLLRSCTAPLLLTPHEGEFRRLGGGVENGRLSGAAGFLAPHPDLTLILKGHGTLVCHQKEIAVNPTGSAAMAKGGSGDVLSGMLCGLLAQGFEPFRAARCAVYLHGLAGDLAAEELGEYCVTPSDIIRYIPKAFRKLSLDR